VNRLVPQPVDLVLHIGCDKTGTTSIQQFLRRNRAALRDQGCLYPRTPGQVRHSDLGLYARSDDRLVGSRLWQRTERASPDQFRRRLRRRLLRETAASGASTVVLSDEALYKLAPGSIARLRGLFDDLAGTVRVVVYLRRQDDHLVSSYQQAVRVGQVLDFAGWARKDFAGVYDYAGWLASWQRELAPVEIAVRPFERPRFRQGSLTEDFLHAAGLDVDAADLKTVEVRNESLGAETVEVLRILNLYRVEHEGAQRHLISNRQHVKRLRQADQGPQVTLPAADLDRFMARWEESNRRVAREFLGEDDLFTAPRKTANTTTEQLLDPGRLDLYLPLLEIPEEQHPLIRAIAEREAGRPRSTS
jgi:hypothetical protein